jgi:hypothetical protein
MSAEPSHIRPEIAWEVDSFTEMRRQLRGALMQLEVTLSVRMARQQLSPAEDAMISEALNRAD